MPHRNRVTPQGELEAADARSALMGNRGILHDAAGRLGTARWRHPHWVTCRLEFRGRRRHPVLAPGRYTELFFLDEATAFAAGHRPCAECRRHDFARFGVAWAMAHGGGGGGERPRTAEIDRILHAARIEPGSRRQRIWPAMLDTLPTGAFVMLPDQPGEAWLRYGRHLRRWTHQGYDPEVAIPGLPDRTVVTVLTPAPVVAAFAAGYAPALHASATTAHGPDPA
jgi:hypothetical protein